MANVWKHIDARPSLESVAETLQQTLWAMDGKSGRGLPITLTKYDGTSYALDAQSAEATNGNTFRARSQNTTYGITLNNSGLILIGDVTASASLYMSGTLNVGGAATVSGALLVGGAATFNGNITSGGTHWSIGDFWVGPTAAPVASILAASGDYASTGKISLTPAAAITTFKRQFESTFTWNNGTTAMNAMVLALTDTASGTTSTFFECLSTGVSKFSVRKDGLLSIAGQIAFPSAQNTSSDANTLDDYRESTWSPTDSSGAGLSLTVTSATYTKIGRQAHIQGFVSYPSTASTAAAVIGGAPFTIANQNYAAFGCDATAMTALQLSAGSTSLVPRGAGLANLTNAQLSGKNIIFSATYQV